MARNNGRRNSQFAANPSGALKALGFFSSVDSSAENVAGWDIKGEVFASTVLRLLGAGYSLGLYTAWHGEAITFRIYQGDNKDDHMARDSVEFDKLVWAIHEKLAREEGGDKGIAE